MRRAREDDYEDPVQEDFLYDPEAREDDAHVVTRAGKRARNGPMASLTFVTTEYDTDGIRITNNYYFGSQDIDKRRHVLHAIRDLAKMNGDGPLMADLVLAWVAGELVDDPEQNMPDTYRDIVVEVYMKLNPQAGEWSCLTETSEVVAADGSTITYIGAEVDDDSE